MRHQNGLSSVHFHRTSEAVASNPSWLSTTTPDWSREQCQRWWEPGRRLLRSIRGYQRARARGDILGWLARKYHALQYHFWSMVSGAEIPINCTLGGGLLLPHPNGIVLHPEATIGINCIIFQQVTIGGESATGLPVVGADVMLGAGAKVLGNVVIGDHARIGANAVVVRDVPPGATAVGVPARVIPGTERGLRSP